MYAQELQHPEKVSAVRVKNVGGNVKKIKNTKLLVNGMKPNNAIKLDIVRLGKTFPEKSLLPEYGLYRYLCHLSAQHGSRKRQATYFIWSKKMYRSARAIEKPGNCVLYYSHDGRDRPFVREELMHILEDTNVTPEWVNKWK